MSSKHDLLSDEEAQEVTRLLNSKSSSPNKWPSETLPEPSIPSLGNSCESILSKDSFGTPFASKECLADSENNDDQVVEKERESHLSQLDSIAYIDSSPPNEINERQIEKETPKEDSSGKYFFCFGIY